MVRVGQRLYQERLQRKLTLDDIAKETKIKARFLAAIEKGEYEKLPSPAYAKGFVRNYADYLGLPRAEVTALFRREFDEKRAYKVLPDSMVKKNDLSFKPKRIQHSFWFIIGGIFFFLLLYLGIQYRSFFFAPALSIDSPKQEIVTSTEVTIAGKTDSNATVLINNQTVSVASNGDFSKTIILFPGKSVVTIKAKNRMGKETVERRIIQVKQ